MRQPRGDPMTSDVGQANIYCAPTGVTGDLVSVRCWSDFYTAGGLKNARPDCRGQRCRTVFLRLGSRLG
jgi:hypothetical protein